MLKPIHLKEGIRYLQQYRKIIEKNKNYLELFFPNEKPYNTFWYHADEGMLWASMFLELLEC